jgi:N-acetylglucosaminyl-diphospho-decaprenol L-rhamnosyltransferase
MDDTVSHALLTRFNLPSLGVENVIRAKEGWLEGRVALFERYCIPSVLAQRNRGFKWLIYFDIESPRWLKRKVAEHTASGIYTALFRTSVSPVELEDDIESAFGGRRANLLTTNLDNDDCLAVDFIERLQVVIPSIQRRAIFFVHGLIMNDHALYLRTDRHNAFCSVLEPWDAPRTCWFDWHNLLPRTMPVLELEGHPAWLQVIHGANVSNRIRGHLVNSEPYRELFGDALENVRKPTGGELAMDRLVAGPMRVLKEAIRKTGKWVIMRTAGKGGLDRVKVQLKKTTGQA